MKKKETIDINENVTASEINTDHSVPVTIVKKGKEGNTALAAEAGPKPLAIADDGANHPPQSKAAFKAQLKEAKKQYQNAKAFVKKAKKEFKKTSKKADEGLYQIAKFNFAEAKNRKKDQKQQLKELKKMRKLFKKPKRTAKK